MNVTRYVTTVAVLAGLVQLSNPWGSEAVAAGGPATANTGKPPAVVATGGGGGPVVFPATPAADQRKYQIESEFNAIDHVAKLTDEQKPQVKKALETKYEEMDAFQKNPQPEIDKLPEDPQPEKKVKPETRAYRHLQARLDAKVFEPLTDQQREALLADGLMRRTNVRSLLAAMDASDEQKKKVDEMAQAAAKKLAQALGDADRDEQQWAKVVAAVTAEFKQLVTPAQREDMLAEHFLGSLLSGVGASSGVLHTTVAQRGQMHLMAVAAAKKVAADTKIVLLASGGWPMGGNTDAEMATLKEARMALREEVKDKVLTDAQRQKLEKYEAELKKMGATVGY